MMTPSLWIGVIAVTVVVSFIPAKAEEQQRHLRREQSFPFSSFDPELGDGFSIPHGSSETRQLGSYHTVIVGAGAAGLSACYTLMNAGGVTSNQIRILEASDRIGGRTQKDTTFVSEFALEVGASMIQYYEQIEDIVGPGKIDSPSGMAPTFSEYTYWDFFNDYIAPKNQEVYEFGCFVTSVIYVGDRVETTCRDGRSFLSDNVIVAVPQAILQGGYINFQPPVPTSMTVNHPGSVWQGMKIFLEFADSFFSRRGFCLDSLGSCIDDDGEQLFWDFTSVNGPLESGNTILTGFILGDRSEPLIDLADEIILQRVLDLLDDEFDGMASISFVKGFVKNWSKDPNFLGALSSCGYDCYDESRSGAQALDDKVWIAGEAFPIDGNNGWVDAGAFSGDDAAKQILRRKDGISVPNTLFWVRVRDDLESATPSPSIPPNPPPTPNPTLPLTPIPTSNPILPPIPNPTRPPTPPPTPFPTSSPVLAPTPTPVPVSCTLNAIECVANSDCCSQRCFSGICRVASGGGRDRDGLKISFGQAGGAAEDRNPLIGGQRGNIYAGFGI